MGCGNCKLTDTTDLETLNNIKGHFEDQWMPGRVHVDTMWKTTLFVLLIQVGGFGIFKLTRWIMRRRAARKAAKAKAVWDQWYGSQQIKRPTPTVTSFDPLPHDLRPSAPLAPFPEGGQRGQEWGRARDRAVMEEWANWRAMPEEQARQRGIGNRRIQYHRELPPSGGATQGAAPTGTANRGQVQAEPHQAGSLPREGLQPAYNDYRKREVAEDLASTLQQGAMDKN